jgi:hypothetical protein
VRTTAWRGWFHKLVFDPGEDMAEIVEESVARTRENEDRSQIGLCLCIKVVAAVLEDDFAKAQEDLDEAVDCLRACGDLQAMAVALHNRALIDMRKRDMDNA